MILKVNSILGFCQKCLALLLILSILGCTSLPQQSTTSQQSSDGQTPLPGNQAHAIAEPYFTGNGGSGLSLGILVPESQGLGADQAYLPTMVQGVFVSNISKYSAISVLDRPSLERVIEETENLIYEDNSDIIQLGKIAQVGHMMTGRIIRTSSGFTLQINVTDTNTAMTIASYSGTSTVEQFENHTAIHQASQDLLRQMGVQLTSIAVAELDRAGTQESIDAEAALARGITAQRQGTDVVALSYFFQAATMNPALLEATNRASVLSANIISGNIGEDVRNDIVWRRNWVERLTETEQFFAEFNRTESLPFTLYYSDAITQGAVNYQNETVVLSIQTSLHPSNTWVSSVGGAMQQTLRAVYDGLQTTQRASTWELNRWPRQRVTNLNPFERQSRDFTIVAELVNDRNQVIGRQTFQSAGWWEFTYNGNAPANVSVSGDARRTVNFTVRADDITDMITIRIATVNGIPAETAARNGILQVRAIPDIEYDRNIRFTIFFGEIRGYTGSGGSVTIPSSLWDEQVSSIGDGAFRSKQLTGVTIPDTVTFIRDNAFSSNQLTDVTIPGGVTFIGDNAFNGNPLDKISIGANVPMGRNNPFGSRGFTNIYMVNRRRGGIYVYYPYTDRNGGTVDRWVFSELRSDATESERQEFAAAQASDRRSGTVAVVVGGVLLIAGIVLWILFTPDYSQRNTVW